MKLLSMITLLVAAGMFAAGPVNANEPATTGDKSVHRIKADANNDGKISYEEFKTAGEKRVERHFKHMDANSDGFIDQAERQTAFDKIHKHGNCHSHNKSGDNQPS